MSEDMDWQAIRREYEETDITLANLAAKYGIKYPTLKSRKQRQGWEKKDASLDASKAQKDASVKKAGAPKGNKNAVGHGAPKGNQNAVGGKGGPGPPPGSKNALKTGEFESIWFDCLTETEQALYSNINLDTLAQVEEDIRLITVRERRMMERIKRLMDGLTEKERKVLYELQTHKKMVEVFDEQAGHVKIVPMPETKLVITEVTEIEARAIDDIVKLEEALTRVQEKKAKLLTLKHTIENPSNSGSSGNKQKSQVVQIIDDISGSDGDEHAAG